MVRDDPDNGAMRLWELPTRVGSMWRAGLYDPLRPDEGLRIMFAVRALGPLAGPVRVAARRDPNAVGLVDERGRLSYRDLDQRSNALARAWARHGLGPGSVVAVLCRDHRGLVDCLLAGAKLGARVLLLNTGFGGPQLADVVAREGVSALVHDAEFSDLLSGIEVPRFLGWAEESADNSLDSLIESAGTDPLPDPASAGSLVLLTSGTTGTPKGAPRQVRGVLAITHFVERVPWRSKEATYIGTPVFHATGLSHLILAFALASTVVVRRRFDPAEALRVVRENQCSAMVLVPTMLRRILDLPTEVSAPSVRIILTAGSPLTPDLCRRTAEVFGDVLYNLYGSTEVAVATIATPEELRAAPGTVGRAPSGCTIRLYDDQDNRVAAAGVTGRIFVGSELSFHGYTNGGDKNRIDGLLASGDVGHLDPDGLLFVDGRDDDMIVSGGENVFPVEVENLILARPDVRDAAVIGVPDEEFGQRLKAFVVRHDDSGLDEDTVRDHVRAHLARFKVPREVVFLDELPRNPTGKVLRRELH